MHGCQKRDLCLGGSSRKVPESKAISGNRNNIGPIEKSLLKGKKTSREVAKHAPQRCSFRHPVVDSSI